jgi:hypothetical protein
MRCSVFLFFIALNAGQVFAQAPQPTVEKAHLEGQITNLAGEPLKKAAVRLQGTFTSTPTTNTGAAPAMPTAYTSESDAAGHFVFEEVEPGRYTLSAERTGYVRSSYGARSASSPPTVMNLAAGQKMTGISVKLTPQGIISGKITDEDGDPVERAQVMILQWRYQNGQRALMPSGTASMTLADGSFQISGLAEGRYYLSAADLRQSIISMGPAEQPGRKGPQESYVTTYYPNGTDVANAVPVNVASGAEVHGIEIRLQKARVFRVHGKLVGGGPFNNAAMQLIPNGDGMGMFAAIFSGSPMSVVRTDGTFDFPRALPGTYLIRSQVLRMNNDATTPLYAYHVITVSNANIDDLEVPVMPPSELSGKVTIEGQDQQQKQQNDAARSTAAGSQAPTARPTVGLIPSQFSPGSNAVTAQSSDDGTFRLKNIGPDKYRINVNGLPAGTYVKQIRYGGQDVGKSVLDATSGASGELHVLLSPDAADLSGVVHNSKGDVMPGVTVNLWEPATANTLPEELLNRATVADQNGNFQMRNPPPGEYRVAAWETFDSNLQDPQFRAKFESQAATVKLAASAHANVDAPGISQEAIDVESAKLK